MRQCLLSGLRENGTEKEPPLWAALRVGGVGVNQVPLPSIRVDGGRIEISSGWDGQSSLSGS